MMAIKPITQKGHEICQRLTQNLKRNGYWLNVIIDLPFSQLITVDDQQILTPQDYQELQGFCYYHRPFEASYPALCRLEKVSKMSLLTELLQNNRSGLTNQLTSRNEMIKAIKQEVKTWFENQHK